MKQRREKVSRRKLLKGIAAGVGTAGAMLAVPKDAAGVTAALPLAMPAAPAPDTRTPEQVYKDYVDEHVKQIIRLSTDDWNKYHKHVLEVQGDVYAELKRQLGTPSLMQIGGREAIVLSGNVIRQL